MRSHDGNNPHEQIQELERQNLQLRLHNLRLLDQLEKDRAIRGTADAVILIEVKNPPGRWA